MIYIIIWLKDFFKRHLNVFSSDKFESVVNLNKTVLSFQK